MLGVPRAHYDRLLLWARMVVEHHERLGTPRQLWEGNATHNDQITAPYIEDGEHELVDRLERDIDPVLDEAHRLLEQTKAGLDAAAHYPNPVTTPESGSTHSGIRAVELVAIHDNKIESDFLMGKQHHRRIAPWVATIGKWLPWVEALGLLAFIAYFTDVPLLRPWEDWLGFTFGITVVAVVIYGQTRLAHEGAENHNVAREATADGNRHEAERGYRRRNVFVELAGTVAVGISAGLILRGTAVLGNARPSVVALLVFLAILTGLLMPAVSYLSIALDGSKISRERDSIAADLDHDHDELLQITGDCRRLLADIAKIRDTLNTKDFHHICNSIQEIVDRAYTPFNTARLLIGGLTTDPPPKTTRSIQHADGHLSGQVGTGIPGARVINLGPLLDRVGRLTDLDRQRTELHQRLIALPRHPWAKFRTP